MTEIVNPSPDDQHDWVKTYTHQWGCRGGVAYSRWECKKCRVTFDHLYHRIPDIYEAMKQASIKLECNTNEQKT